MTRLQQETRNHVICVVIVVVCMSLCYKYLVIKAMYVKKNDKGATGILLVCDWNKSVIFDLRWFWYFWVSREHLDSGWPLWEAFQKAYLHWKGKYKDQTKWYHFSFLDWFWELFVIQIFFEKTNPTWVCKIPKILQLDSVTGLGLLEAGSVFHWSLSSIEGCLHNIFLDQFFISKIMFHQLLCLTKTIKHKVWP